MSGTLGLLHGLGLYAAPQKKASPPGAIIMLRDVGRFPKSARAISAVLRGKRNWWPASATIRAELKSEVPFDPIGRWFHGGKNYAKADLPELQESMKPGEAVYFRLGVASALEKRGIVDLKKLKVALGADFCKAYEYIEEKLHGT